ncbi:MAG: DUF2817 domain-containing protein [Herpetosiphonaceae bacterium]|nr:DUF2817 domain-containing protein [Herpetosiphonaceae bacterium]
MVRRWLLLILLAAGCMMPPAASRGAQSPPPPVVELTFGASLQGRPLSGTRIGVGPRKLFVVANTHGGPEANTYQLALALQEYFRLNPDEVPPEVSLYIVPTVNPDGLALGTRFNSRGVDLNRNMDTNFDDCPENDWRTTVEGAYGYVSDTGGPFVESEPESQVVRDMVLDASAVIWLHSSGGDVFPALCEHAASIALAQAYAQASGYRYDRFWINYNITGGMHDWAGALGIASITPELATGTEPELAANLAAVQAVLANYERLLPAPSTTIEAASGVEMPALLWRYWRAHGGPDWFGPPISPVVQSNGRATIYFAEQHLVLTPEGADALQPVQRADGGQELWTEYLLHAPESAYQLR